MGVFGSFLEISKPYLSCISVHAEEQQPRKLSGSKDRDDQAKSGEKQSRLNKNFELIFKFWRCSPKGMVDSIFQIC